MPEYWYGRVLVRRFSVSHRSEILLPVDGSDEGPEEGALLTLGLLGGNEDGSAETLVASQTATSKDRWMAWTRDLKKAHCSH